MNRRDFLVWLASWAALPSSVAPAQERAKPVIGYLALGSPESRRPFVNQFRQGLSENGYVESRNIAIEYRWAEDKPERFPGLADELVSLNIDVLVTAGGTAAALAAKRATPTIPIVFTAVGDPVQEGLVASLPRPGGNITGLSFFSPQLAGKRLELLKQAVPEARLVAVLLKPDSMPENVREPRLKEIDASARVLGLELLVVEVRGPEDLDRAFAEMSDGRAGALMVVATPLFVIERRRLAELSRRNGLPAISEFREFAVEGGLMTYGPSIADLNRRAAGYVAKILKGAKPADLPVEQPSKFELVINLKTAKALGLTLPQSILARADEVIE